MVFRKIQSSWEDFEIQATVLKNNARNSLIL